MTDSAELQQSYDLLRMEEKQYQATYRHLINMREMRHDFRQHLLSINEFAQTGQIDKLKEYIAPLIKAVEKKPFQICENQALNAIVSHYDSIAKEQGVRILCGIHLEEALPVNEADVCSVVGNLLENDNLVSFQVLKYLCLYGCTCNIRSPDCNRSVVVCQQNFIKGNGRTYLV